MTKVKRTQDFILDYLALEGPSTMREISKGVGSDWSNTYKAVKQLQNAPTPRDPYVRKIASRGVSSYWLGYPGVVRVLNRTTSSEPIAEIKHLKQALTEYFKKDDLGPLNRALANDEFKRTCESIVAYAGKVDDQEEVLATITLLLERDLLNSWVLYDQPVPSFSPS